MKLRNPILLGVGIGMLSLGMIWMWLWMGDGGGRVEVVFTPFKRVAMDRLLREIGEAKQTLDVAMFWLTDREIMGALGKAAGRGVKVRVIMDEKVAKDMRFIDRFEMLERDGVKVYLEGEAGKLHLKSAIVDGRRVVMGSANWTSYGMLVNMEDVLIIEDEEVVRRYQEVWDGLFANARRWVKDEVMREVNLSQRERPLNPEIDFSKVRRGIDREWDGQLRRVVRVRRGKLSGYFSPRDEGVKEMLRDIAGAQERIDVGMYYVMDGEVITALNSAARRGLVVEVVVSDKMLRSPIDRILDGLTRSGVKVYLPPLDGSTEMGSMHLKCMVIDSRVVWTGSANWTPNAREENIEDMLRIEDERLGRFYGDHLRRLMEISQRFEIPDWRRRE